MLCYRDLILGLMKIWSEIWFGRDLVQLWVRPLGWNILKLYKLSTSLQNTPKGIIVGTLTSTTQLNIHTCTGTPTPTPTPTTPPNPPTHPHTHITQSACAHGLNIIKFMLVALKHKLNWMVMRPIALLHQANWVLACFSYLLICWFFVWLVCPSVQFSWPHYTHTHARNSTRNIIITPYKSVDLKALCDWKQCIWCVILQHAAYVIHSPHNKTQCWWKNSVAILTLPSKKWNTCQKTWE